MLGERWIYRSWKHKWTLTENFAVFWKHYVFHFLVGSPLLCSMKGGTDNKQRQWALVSRGAEVVSVMKGWIVKMGGERLSRRETTGVWGTESRKCLCLFHRTSETRKDLWRLSSPTQLLKAGSTKAVCSGSCPAGLWISPRLETARMKTTALIFYVYKCWQLAFCKICLEL